MKSENTSDYILGKSTCTSIEVVYLFVVVSQKYNISLEILCNALDDHLTIDELARLIREYGDYKND